MNALAGIARRMTPARTAIIVGAVSGGSSATTPLSYDEGLWLAVTRRMDLGARLYSDLLDNKTPPVYWLTRALDHLPGPFRFARGALFGVLIASIVILVCAVAGRLGLPARRRLVLGAFSGTLVALQSAFVLNIETPVVLLLLAGLWLIAIDRVMIGAAIAAAATTIDLRAIAFLPAIALFARWKSPRKAWRAVAFAIVAGGWLAAVLVDDRLRYSLIELNAATRGTVGSWRPGSVIAIVLVALAPVIMASLPYIRGWHRSKATVDSSSAGAILLVTGLAIGIASRFPFLKYWILIAPAIPVLVAAADARHPRPAIERSGRRVRVALVVAAFAPLLVIVSRTQIAEGKLVSRYEAAARTVKMNLRPSDTFTSFDPQPFMTTFLPEHAAVPWATLDYLGVKTSHRNSDLRRLADAIERAAAVVDDGALSADEDAIEVRFREVWRLYHERLGLFPCMRRVEDITIRLRADRCR